MDSSTIIKGMPLSVQYVNYLAREMVVYFEDKDKNYIQDLLKITERHDPSPEIVKELCTAIMLRVGLGASSRWPEENEMAFKALDAASKFCEDRCEPRDGDLDI